MDDVTDTRQISRLEIVDTGPPRRWAAAEKRRERGWEVVGEKAGAGGGELCGSPAGFGDGAPTWDFQPAAVRLAQGVSRRAAWRHWRIRAGDERSVAARK